MCASSRIQPDKKIQTAAKVRMAFSAKHGSDKKYVDTLFKIYLELDPEE